MSRHEDDRAAAVDNAEATLLGFFTQYEWDTATSPVAFRRALEMLWEDGATIGFHEG